MTAGKLNTSFRDNQTTVSTLSPGSTNSINMNNSTILSTANLGPVRFIPSRGGWKSKIISSISLLAYFSAYSHIPMSVWLQLVFAYSVRICLLWTMLSLLLLASRYVNRSIVALISEVYAATFRTTVGIFGIVYFPKFTFVVVGLCMVLSGLKSLFTPIKPAGSSASTTKAESTQ
ncbi:hypothetical protein F5B21DRAFT_459253 [Xylaria acuta]|nr:hypothetical protein F5B21DRAFT_459253 [Xylaria acuta]